MRNWFGRRTPRDEQGAIAILIALLMVVLTVCAAIVVDLGLAWDVRRQSQNAGDAASLAGAAALYPAAISPSTTPKCLRDTVAPPCVLDAEDEVKAYALKNFQVDPTNGWNTCPSVLSGYVQSAGTSCISFSPVASPTKVRVVVPTRTLRTFFGGVTGRSSISVGSSAEAVVIPGVSCSLCFLGDVGTNNSDFKVPDGSIAVNGNVTIGPNSDWTAQSDGVHGTVNGGIAENTPPFTTIPWFGDPLAGLTLPVTTGLPTRTDPCKLPGAGGGPGLYGAISLPNSACTLQPGLYVISGKWDMKNSTKLIGTAGVTLYFMSPGWLEVKNGDAFITAPTAGQVAVSGGLAGYAIIYDPNYTSILDLQGNGNTLFTGRVYAPKTILHFNGNGSFGFSGGPVVLGGSSSVGNKSNVTVTNAVSLEVTAKGLRLDK